MWGKAVRVRIQMRWVSRESSLRGPVAGGHGDKERQKTEHEILACDFQD